MSDSAVQRALDFIVGRWPINTQDIADDAITSAKIPADAVTDSEIAANSVGNSEMKDDAIDSAEIVDGAVDPVHLESTILGAYRTIAQAQSGIGIDATAATFLLGSANSNFVAWRSGVTHTFGVSTKSPFLFYLDNADYDMTGKTTSLRLRAIITTGNTAPGQTFTFGLYPVSASAGGNDQSTLTVGTVVSGSTVAFASPSADGIHQNNSGDFAFPTDGTHVLGVALGGTMADNSAVTCSASLQLHYT